MNECVQGRYLRITCHKFLIKQSKFEISKKKFHSQNSHSHIVIIIFFFLIIFQIIPVVVGIATVLVVAAAAHFYFTRLSKKKLKTLLDSTKKYMLPLIEKEEISHDTKRNVSQFCQIFKSQKTNVNKF